MNSYSPFSSPTYRRFFQSMTSDAQLFNVLVEMPKKYKAEIENVEDVAKEIMQTASDYEYVRDCITDGNTMAAIEDFLKTCSTSKYQRLDILRRINFGLGYYDNKKIDVLLSNADAELDFGKYMDNDAERIDDEEVLKESIMKKLSASCVSSQSLREYAQQLRTSGNVLASSAAFGREGYRIKCIVAMDTYINEDNLTPEDAALLACCTTDAQAYANATKAGEKSKGKAAYVIKGLGKAVSLVVVIYCVLNGVANGGSGVSVTAKKFSKEIMKKFNLKQSTLIGASIGPYLLNFFNEPITDTIGAWAAKNAFVSKEQAEATIQTLEEIADYDESEKSAKVVYDTPCYETEHVANACTALA